VSDLVYPIVALGKALGITEKGPVMDLRKENLPLAAEIVYYGGNLRVNLFLKVKAAKGEMGC